MSDKPKTQKFTARVRRGLRFFRFDSSMDLKVFTADARRDVEAAKKWIEENMAREPTP